MPLVCQKCGQSSNWDTVPDPVAEICTIAVSDVSAAANHRAALAEIEAEIARFKMYAERYIAVLTERQEEVEARLKAAAYPVLSLPTEITSRVFVECLPVTAFGVSPSARHAPLVLTRICRQWRDIALSTCQLWSSLRIESFSCTEIKVPRDTSLGLQTWLSRGRQYPLVLIIKYNIQEVQDLEQLDISSILPRLRCLDASGSPYFLDFQDTLQNAPLLTELHWCWLSNSPNILDFHSFTSHTLTTFDISSDFGWSSLEFITILQNFPSLSEFTCIVNLEADHHHPPLTFPNLVSLSLFRDYDSDLSVVHTLELLTLPNLSSLRCFSPLNPDVTVPFLTRSACVIRKLTCDFYEDQAIISQHLRIFSSVETLDIRVIDIADCLRALDPQSNGANPSSPILPKLRHLTITCERHMMSADYSAIVNVVHGRRTHPDTAELKSFYIYVENLADGNLRACPNCPSDSVAEELRCLTMGGLDLKLHALFPPRVEEET